MRPIQNAGGHVGLTARNYPISADTNLKAAGAAETGAILGIAAEDHPGSADVLNPRANGVVIKVYDSPELIFECPAPLITAASGSATTIVPASGDVASTVADDGYNNSVLELIAKAAESTNTDPVGKRITVDDYTKSGTILTKASGGAPSAGDRYRMFPALGSVICGLNSDRTRLLVSATGATSLRVIGHDFDRGMLRCMAVKHALGGTN